MDKTLSRLLQFFSSYLGGTLLSRFCIAYAHLSILVAAPSLEFSCNNNTDKVYLPELFFSHKTVEVGFSYRTSGLCQAIFNQNSLLYTHARLIIKEGQAVPICS